VRASEIAEFLGSELIGKDIEITGICSLKNPKENHLGFYRFDQSLIISCLDKGLNSIAEMTFLIKPGVPCNCASYIPVDNPRLAHARVTQEFFAKPYSVMLHLSPPGTHVYDCVNWGDDCHFKPGAVIGGSGFGFENDEDGVPIRRPHVGGVVIGNNVEVGANSVIDRGTIDDTIIKDNVKIDNLVHISHNCKIGENTKIVAGSVICGSVTIGKNCWIGANVTVMNQITIGNNVTIGIGAVVVKDVSDGAVLAGFKAQPIEVMKQITKDIENG